MLATEIVELASGEPYATCSALVPEFCPTACWWCVELELCSASWQECAVMSTPSKDDGGGSSASSGVLPLMLTAVLLLLLASVLQSRSSYRAARAATSSAWCAATT